MSKFKTDGDAIVESLIKQRNQYSDWVRSMEEKCPKKPEDVDFTTWYDSLSEEDRENFGAYQKMREKQIMERIWSERMTHTYNSNYKNTCYGQLGSH